MIAAYEREQQAMAAPTRLREGFGSLAVENGPETDSSAIRTRGDDAAQIAAVVQGLVRQNGNSQVIRTAAQTRPTRTDENGVHLDRLEIMEVDP